MSDKLKIKIHDFEKKQILVELIDEFYSKEEYILLPEDGFRKDQAIHINLAGHTDKDEIKREIFRTLRARKGSAPDWGILTGVRPVKLAGEMMERGNSPEETKRVFMEDYYLSEEKASLIVDVYNRQKRVFGKPADNSVGIYVGIPFCPTRCVYCSFASNQVPPQEIQRYLPALHREIEYTGQRMRENGLFPESIYIGGGTPTTLEATQLDSLLKKLRQALDVDSCREFTVEAGRPDTITEDKLDVLRHHGVSRISINPQSMHQKTLDAIGRSHTPEDIERAFHMAGRKGFQVINADVIAGLPGENPEDFRETLERVLAMGANNVTVHTLAVKRASRLRNIDQEYHFKAASTVSEMLAVSRDMLRAQSFVPYYLYRQKHMAGYYENVGYCQGETDNLYNVRIMDEHQTIIALGAGGITKRYYPQTNRLERIPNVTNYQEYIARIEEMCQRKENKLWR